MSDARYRLYVTRGTVRGTIELTVRTLRSAIALASAEGARLGPGWTLEIRDSQSHTQWRIET